MLKPAVERGGKVLGGDTSADPYPCLLDAILGQLEVRQVLLHLWKQEEVSGELGGLVTNWMALAANQFLAAAKFFIGELFQPQISVYNGPNGKIR